MNTIFSWSPLVWAMRILALLMVGGVGIITVALLIRLLRPSNLKRLACGGLPLIWKGRFAFMGQELEVTTLAESGRDEQSAALRSRVNDMAQDIDELAMHVRSLLVEQSRRRDERIQPP